MSKTGLEVVAKAVAFYFFRGVLCELQPHPRYHQVPSVVSPMGDKIGYIVDGQMVTKEQMKEILNHD